MTQIQYCCLIQIQYLHCTLTHPSLSKLLYSDICYSFLKQFSFLPTSSKYRTYSYLINTVMKIFMVTKSALYVTSSMISTSKLYRPRHHSPFFPPQVNTALVLIWSIPSWIHLWLQNPPCTSPLLWCQHQNYTNHDFLTTKPTCSLFPNVQITHPYYTTYLHCTHYTLHAYY